MEKSRIDAIIDGLDEDESPATALADLLDKTGNWDWSDGSEHEPSDRLAIVESTGAYWLVYRGTEGDKATRFGTEDEAEAELERIVEMIEG